MEEYSEKIPESGGNQRPLGLGWHKFLIYFALWANALLNIQNGVMLLFARGAVNPGLSGEVFSGLLMLDKIMGVGYIAMGGYAVYARFCLAGFQKNAVKLLHLVYLFPTILMALQILALYLICGTLDPAVFSNLFGSALSTLVMILINRSYYGKRVALFT